MTNAKGKEDKVKGRTRTKTASARDISTFSAEENKRSAFGHWFFKTLLFKILCLILAIVAAILFNCLMAEDNLSLFYALTALEFMVGLLVVIIRLFFRHD